MGELAWTPWSVTAGVPNSARIWNYLLGGKDNYEVDRQLAQLILQLAPDTRTLAWFSRRFCCDAVTLAAEAGIRQFIDLGAGLPISPVTHEIAWKHNPSARVVYVDDDPVVYAHGNVLVHPHPEARMMLADIRHPGELITRLRTETGIDFDRPVAVIMCGVLDYVLDDEHPGDILGTLRAVVAPGSYLALTHQTDQSAPFLIDRIRTETKQTPAESVFRPIEQIAAFTTGWSVLAPGLVTVQDWLGVALPSTRLEIAAGVYRKESAN